MGKGIKKVGMNSQTLRLVYGGADGIEDVHISDGLTASYMMSIISGESVCLDKYEHVSIASETDPMSWGTDKDKMTDIMFTSVGTSLTLSDSPSAGGYRNRSISMFYTPTPRIPVTSYPVLTTLRSRSSTFSETNENTANFKNLFGK